MMDAHGIYRSRGHSMIRPACPFCRLLFTPLLAVMLLTLWSPSLHAAASCDPRAFGAKADGVAKDSAAIVLKSNITLQLDKGATLLGSPDHSDYPAKTEFRLPDVQSLVGATGASNVAISGDGVIDGNGESWW